MEKQIFVTNAVTETASSDVEGLGTLRWVGDNMFRWVINKDAANLSVGAVAYHKAADAANALSYIYDLNTAGAANAGFMAGVVMAATLEFYAAADSTKKCYGWVQVFGMNATVSMYSSGGTAIAAGDVLKGQSATTTALGKDAVVHDSGYGDHTQTQVDFTDSTGGAASTTLPAPTTLTQTTLTDSSGGTTSTTLASIALPETWDSTDAGVLAGKHAVASLAAELALIKTDVAAVQTNQKNYVASLAAQADAGLVDVAGVIVTKMQNRNILAMAAQTTGVTTPESLRGFIRCL